MMKQSKGAGPDFDLPDEVLAVIPTDPYDQLDLARKITSMAIASRVSNLESEVARLRQKMQDKDRLVLELEDQVSQLNQAYHEADTRLKIAHDDNTKLRKERDSLAMTAKRLGRDLAKLETFKRQLMQSLNDDNSSTTETVDIVTYDHSVLKPYAVKDEVNGHTASHSFSSSTESEYTSDASKQAVQRYSLTPYITPRLTPTGTPKNPSTTGSPIRYSGAGSPRRTSNIPSPTRTQRIGSGTLSSWYPSSQQSSGASSPHRLPVPGRTPRIDGKEFFRQARSRLSYEQFSAFLANIKEFNAQKQSREETLRKAEEIFGLDNRDLYLSFQGLLNRNGH